MQNVFHVECRTINAACEAAVTDCLLPHWLVNESHHSGTELTFPVWLQAVLRSLCSGGPLSALSSHQAHHTCYRIFILIRSRRSFPWTLCCNCAVTLYNHWVVQEYQKEECGLLKRRHILYSQGAVTFSNTTFNNDVSVFFCVNAQGLRSLKKKKNSPKIRAKVFRLWKIHYCTRLTQLWQKLKPNMVGFIVIKCWVHTRLKIQSVLGWSLFWMRTNEKFPLWNVLCALEIS